MNTFIEEQWDAIIELMTAKNDEAHWIKKTYQITGNIIFLLTFSVLVGKGLWGLFGYIDAYYLQQWRITYPWLTGMVSTLSKTAFVWLLLLSLILLLLRGLLLVKHFCKPYQVIGFYAYCKVLYSLILIVFFNDSEKYIDTLQGFVKSLF